MLIVQNHNISHYVTSILGNSRLANRMSAINYDIKYRMSDELSKKNVARKIWEFHKIFFSATESSLYE